MPRNPEVGVDTSWQTSTGQFKKGNTPPDDKRCDVIRRRTGTRCKQFAWRTKTDGKKICHFHDKSRKPYKGQKVNRLPPVYRSTSAILAKFMEGTKAKEADILSLTEEVNMVRLALDNPIAISLNLLMADPEEISKDQATVAKTKAMAQRTMLDALGHVEKLVTSAAKVRSLVAGSITPEQVKEVVDHVVSVIHSELNKNIPPHKATEIMGRVHDRILKEVTIPNGVGYGSGSQKGVTSNPQLLVEEMDRLTLGEGSGT